MNDYKLWCTSTKDKIFQVNATPDNTEFYLFSTKWTNPLTGKKRKYDAFVKIWWGKNSRGYTYDLNEAGTYSKQEILESPNHFCAEGIYPLPAEMVKAGLFGKVMTSIFN